MQGARDDLSVVRGLGRAFLCLAVLSVVFTPTYTARRLVDPSFFYPRFREARALLRLVFFRPT